MMMNTKEAAKFLGLSPGTLACWRCLKRYELPFIKVGRNIRYEESDLHRWLISRKINRNAEAEARARDPFYDVPAC